MRKLQCRYSCTTRFFLLTFIVILSCTAANAAERYNMPDTGKKMLLASLDKKKDKAYITLEPNVVYPAVLAGNEKESLEYIEKFAEKRRDYLIRTYTKGKKYFPQAAAILKKYNVPDELKVLMALESAFNGNAVSKAGAVGYWQFMDEVAKEYGLKVTTKTIKIGKTKATKKGKAAKVKTKTIIVKDDRKNFHQSTTAAARYLKDRYRNLDGDWLLIVASYNCGVGNVWNAMEKCGKTDPDFWDVKDYLPAETRAYVMNFIALNVIFNNYDGFIKNTLRFQPIKIKASEYQQMSGDDEEDNADNTKD
jgi:hypothetical protein